MEEEMLTIQEVADRLRVDVTTVRRWIGYGVLDVVVLPHKHKRKSYRVKAATLEKIVKPKL